MLGSRREVKDDIFRGRGKARTASLVVFAVWVGGVGMLGCLVALERIRRVGVPLAAPSANRFGRTSPTTAAHVLQDLDGRIDAVLDGGATTVGLESTVIGPAEDGLGWVLYRPGGVGLEMLEVVCGVGVGAPVRAASATGRGGGGFALLGAGVRRCAAG